MTAAALVRGWVGLYTRGLPAEVRDARRAEIESDLWSQTEEAEYLGQGASSVEIEMLARLVLGIPADIGWRQAHRRGNAATPRKEIGMHEPRSRRLWTAVGAVWASLGIAFGVGGFIDIRSHVADRPEDVAAASAAAGVIVVGCALALLGLLRIGRDPNGGRQLALGGAVVAGGTTMFLLSWMWVVGIVLALPLVVVAVVSAHQVTEPGPATARLKRSA
jgi:hypothetical protein